MNIVKPIKKTALREEIKTKKTLLKDKKERVKLYKKKILKVKELLSQVEERKTMQALETKIDKI